MPGTMDSLAAVIAAHLGEWEGSPPFVELAIFATDDAMAIAGAIDRFCLRHLGSSVTQGLFHQSSIGSVTGVVLEDGRAVVVKAHQPERSRQFLAEIVRLQSWLAERKTFATEVLAGPLPLGRGHAIVEAFTDAGAKADAHRPEIRRALAEGLQTMVRTCEPLAQATAGIRRHETVLSARSAIASVAQWTLPPPTTTPMCATRDEASRHGRTGRRDRCCASMT